MFDMKLAAKITKKMYLPEGLVIPYRQAGTMSRIKIRRSNLGGGLAVYPFVRQRNRADGVEG